MKKVFFSLLLTANATFAQQQFSIMDLIGIWPGWATASSVPATVGIDTALLQNSVNGYGYLFEKPAPGSSQLNLWVKEVDAKGNFSIKEVVADVSTPPSDWNGAPFNGLSNTVNNPNGSSGTYYQKPVVIKIAKVSKFTGFYGDSRAVITRWTTPEFKAYLSNVF